MAFPSHLLPTITLHGTAKESLVSALMNSWNALEAALNVLQETAPNGRDFPDADVLRAAIELHRWRVIDIKTIMDSIMDQAIQICEKE